MDRWKATALILGGILIGSMLGSGWSPVGSAMASTDRYLVSEGKETSTQGNTQLGFFRVKDSVTGKCYLVVRIWGVGGAGGGVTESPCDPG